MNIYDVAELQQYLYPQVNQRSTQLIDPTMLLRQRSPLLGIQSQRLNDPQMTLLPQIPTGITASSAAQDVSPIPFGTSVDNIQGFTDKEDFSETETKTGIAKLFEFLQKFSPINMVGQLLPEQDPRAINIKNFYGSQFGLTPTGSVASGIMKGYNPVSGGFLNMITGGKYGTPTKYGLAGAMQRRIENILGRRIPQTDASRAKVKELRDLQLREMEDRADRGESLSSIGKTTFSGPGMAFEQKGGGYSVNKDTGEKRFYGGR